MPPDEAIIMAKTIRRERKLHINFTKVSCLIDFDKVNKYTESIKGLNQTNHTLTFLDI